MRTLNIVALVLIIVGGLNWGLVGLFNFDLVEGIFGPSGIRSAAPISRIIYILVGLAALYGIYLLKPLSRDRISDRI